MNERQISISTCFDYSLSIETQIPLISEAGFTHVSIGSNRYHFDYRSGSERDKLRELLNRHSLKIDTIHGPDADKPEVVEELKELSEAAAELEAPVVVIHGGPFTFNEYEFDSRFAGLIKVCRDIEKISGNTGITFALENVHPGPATELSRRILLEIDSQYIGFCYDSSHDQIYGPNPFDLLNELKGRLVAVHISDRIKEFVDHVIPGEGFIDWTELCRILKEAKMTFPLLFEVMTTHSSEKDPTRFLNSVYDRACALYDKIFS